MTPILRSSNLTHYGLLFAAVFFAFFWNIWGFPLFDLDEGAFSEATREMLASGNFAATYLDGAPRYDKPILSYWFQALSVSLFDLNEFALRLPSAIAASCWVWVSYRFARQQWDAETALYVVLIMANTLWISIIGKAAIADAWLNLFVTLTVLDIWRYWQQPERRSLLFRVYLWMALGMLTKGPVAILVPLLVSGIFFILQGEWRRWLKAIFFIPGWVLLLLILTPWLWLVYLDQGFGFFEGFLLDHNLKRFSDTREGHGGKLWYYLFALPLVLLPFSAPLFSALRRAKALCKDSLTLYLFIWLAVVFVLVSISGTQLPHYVVYGITGLLLIFARYRDQLFRGWSFIFPLLFFGLMLALPWILESVAGESKKLYQQEMLSRVWDVVGWPYVAASVVALLLTIGLILSPKLSRPAKMVSIGFIQTIFMFNFFIQVMGGLQQQPIREAAMMAKQRPGQNVVAYHITMPSFSVYREGITAKVKPRSGDLIFTDADNITPLRKEFPQASFEVIYNKGGIRLVEWLNAKSAGTD
ncbi:ArnT family glycosyltransferase [Amphritea balenae]|uniref:Glycosyltransferase family 39 protein n=1 Tax=Amphritea balenae TaxID=452629 RepID=A0A3P1SMT0_9GAMM|nr:glycosyltransferase family 39 protein [Amphritea balenae]RRC98561.1 glycosyltransferase family 39 protein [Amphritea balenae]GGK65523.1 glycosyl hydrolase [Amphritea balenae]